jgi:hypothetical protein
MKRTLWIGLIIGGLLGIGLTSALRSHEAAAQKPNEAGQWEYKVGIFSYNPGEQITDEKRAVLYERAIKEHAAQGWEPVGSIMSRDTVQTVGGGVTTRDTTSFVAYRRKR